MALTRDNVVTTALIEAAGGLSSGDITTAMRDRAIVKALLALGYTLKGTLSDTNNPFISTERTERVTVGEGETRLRMRFWPITDISDITDENGTSLGWTKDEDFYIVDYDTSLDQVVAFTGWIKNDSGWWTPGIDTYRVTYTAGYDATTNPFPQGLQEAIIQLALWDRIASSTIGLKTEKVGNIAYSYGTSDSPFTGNVGVPQSILNMLKQFMPPAW